MVKHPGMMIPVAKGKRGVALIMVLGLLSIMLVLAVAFTTLSRSERAASANYTRGVQARLMLDAAIIAAMSDIESTYYDAAASIGKGVYPDRSNPDVWDVGNAEPRIMYSKGAGNVANNWSAKNLVPVNTYAKSGFPVSMRGKLDAARDLMRWIPIQGGGIEGRYAYVAGNFSGLADINFVGNAPREVGASPYELFYEGLDDLVDVGEQGNLVSTLDTRLRLEDNWEVQLYAGPHITGDPNSFTVFSHYPTGVWDTVTGSVNTSLPYELSSINVSNLVEVGFSSTEAGYAYTNYQDYVDADNVPTSLDGPFVELVPMINEVHLETTLGAVTTNSFQLTGLNLSLELFWPFIIDQTSGVEVVFTGDLEADAGAGFVSAHAVAGFVSPPINGMSSMGPQYEVVAVVSNLTKTVTTPVTTLGGIDFRLNNVDVQVRPAGGGTDLDRAYAKSSAPILPLAINAGATGDMTTECVDPRFNWDLNDSTFWIEAASANTLNAENTVTTTELAKLESDIGTGMYVRDAAMSTVGELGYLCVAPWQTIRLTPVTKAGSTRNPDPVYDYFVLTNEVKRGLIHLNSEYVDVLAALFNDLALTLYPGQARGSLQAYSVANAQGLAQEVWDDVDANGPMINLSSVQEIEALYDGSIVAYSATDTEIQREAILRNSGDLMGVRHNLIQMVLLVETGVDVDGDTVLEDDEILASQKATAMVWRDAYPKYSSPAAHPMFVRRLRLLDE